MSRRWWVVAPGAGPVSYRSKAAAQRAARSVKGAAVTTSPRGGKHTSTDKGYGGGRRGLIRRLFG